MRRMIVDGGARGEAEQCREEEEVAIRGLHAHGFSA
jgi:hypothetical protein